MRFLCRLCLYLSLSGVVVIVLYPVVCSWEVGALGVLGELGLYHLSPQSSQVSCLVFLLVCGFMCGVFHWVSLARTLCTYFSMCINIDLPPLHIYPLSLPLLSPLSPSLPTQSWEGWGVGDLDIQAVLWPGGSSCQVSGPAGAGEVPWSLHSRLQCPRVVHILHGRDHGQSCDYIMWLSCDYHVTSSTIVVDCELHSTCMRVTSVT